MKKTATVTWIKFHNFGTFLQAYALQQVILQQGYMNDILDDSFIYVQDYQKNFSLWRRWLHRLKRVLCHVLYWRFRKCQRISDALYASFQKDELLVNSDICPLRKLNERYDIFICGSDQIWFPSDDIFSPYYYLDFVDKKKIAYAPSLGVTNYPKNFVPKVKPLLERFDFISVREKQGERLLLEFLDKEIETVLDPTLLLSPVDWKKLIEGMPSIKGDYMLCYFLTPNTWYLNFVRDFAKQKKLPIRIFCTHPSYIFWQGCTVAGPKEFLNYLFHSSYFFTDSFHGSIFSILFEKRFCTFKRFEDSSEREQNSRITNLFSLLGLQDYFVSQNELEKVKQLPLIDYSQVMQHLNILRAQSLEYLIHALEN